MKFYESNYGNIGTKKIGSKRTWNLLNRKKRKWDLINIKKRKFKLWNLKIIRCWYTKYGSLEIQYTGNWI